MSQYFPKSYEPFGRDINVRVDLPHYAPKPEIKNVPHVETSRFALQQNLPNLKTEVNKLDVDKLVPVLVDLSKLEDVVKNEVVKKTVYDKLVAKLNSIDTSAFVLKTKYDTDKKVLEIKSLVLMVMLKRQITIPKSLKQRVNYQVFVIQLQLLH